MKMNTTKNGTRNAEMTFKHVTNGSADQKAKIKQQLIRRAI